MKYFLPIIILVIIFTPTFNIGGIPLRIEDVLLISLLLYQGGSLKNLPKHFSAVLFVFVVFIIVNFLSLYIEILKGYEPNLQDFNTLALYSKSLLFLIGGFIIGLKANRMTENYLINVFGLGLFISSILAIIQFFDLFGLGMASYRLYGNEDRIQYGISRVIGVFGNPNYAAYFHSIGFFLYLSIVPTTHKVSFLKSILMVCTCLLAVVLTFSRTGILALIITLLFSLIYKRKFRVIFYFLISSILLGVIFLDNLIKGTRFSQIMEGSSGGSFSDFGSRTDSIWVKRFESFFTNPLIGTGPGKNRLSDTVFNTSIFDNTFLLLLITSGLIGLFFYFLFYWKLFEHFIKSVDISSEMLRGNVVNIMLLTVLFFFTTDMIWSINFVGYFYLFIGVAYSFIHKSMNSVVSEMIR